MAEVAAANPAAESLADFIVREHPEGPLCPGCRDRIRALEAERKWTEQEFAQLTETLARAEKAEADLAKMETVAGGLNIEMLALKTEVERLKADRRPIPETLFGLYSEIQDCLTYIKQLLIEIEKKRGGRERGEVPFERPVAPASGGSSPGHDDTAAAYPAAHVHRYDSWPGHTCGEVRALEAELDAERKARFYNRDMWRKAEAEVERLKAHAKQLEDALKACIDETPTYETDECHVERDCGV